MALSRVKVWVSGETLTAADLNAEFQNILDNAASLISPLGGALDWDGFAHVLDAAGVTTAQSTAAIGWSFTPGSKSGTPGTTGGISNWAASTWTDSNTAGSGTATNWVGHAFQRPTIAASNSLVTTTNAATVYIANAPLAGTNETLTNTYALWVDDGIVRFDGATVNSGALAYTWPAATGTLPTIATQAEVNAMTSTGTGLTPNHNKLVLDTAKASTSGTSVDFTSIPAGVRRITMMLDGVSTNGTSDIVFQIGDSGGIENSGYLGAMTSLGAGVVTANFTASHGVTTPGAGSNVHHGTITLTLLNSSTFSWAITSSVSRSDGALVSIGASTKSLSAELTQVRLTTAGGVNTFDAGSINCVYER